MFASGLKRRLLESHLVIAFTGIVFVGVLFVTSYMLRYSSNQLAERDGPNSLQIFSLRDKVHTSSKLAEAWLRDGDPQLQQMHIENWHAVAWHIQRFQETARIDETLIKRDDFHRLLAYLNSLESLYDELYMHKVENSFWALTKARKFFLDQLNPVIQKTDTELGMMSDRAAAKLSIRHADINMVSAYSLYASGVALFGLVLAAIIISLSNANKMISRLKGLSLAVQDYSDGNTASPVPVLGNDEISNLTRIFNKMALSVSQREAALSGYRVELERNVLERTQELQRSKELAETTLRSIADAVISTDSGGRITMMNAPAEALTGHAGESAIGQPMDAVLRFLKDGQSLSVAQTPIANAFRSNDKVDCQDTLELLQGNGNTVAVQVSASPIMGDSGYSNGAILVLRDISKELELQSELAYQANHDVLTGLANRTQFQSDLRKLLKSVRDGRRTHVLACLDLDRFKLVNDSCGHAAGDELLRQLAKLLDAQVRQADTLARIGGDEFAILFYDCSVEQAVNICRSIRDEVSRFRFNWNESTFKVGVSVGVAEINAGTQEVSNLLSLADSACYDAKEAGRNRVCVARESMTASPVNIEEMGWIKRD